MLHITTEILKAKIQAGLDPDVVDAMIRAKFLIETVDREIVGRRLDQSK